MRQQAAKNPARPNQGTRGGFFPCTGPNRSTKRDRWVPANTAKPALVAALCNGRASKSALLRQTGDLQCSFWVQTKTGRDQDTAALPSTAEEPADERHRVFVPMH
jgi:hypothetical protein